VLGKPTQQALQLFAIAILFVFTPRILAGEIALTFDDAPMRGTAIMSGNERTEKLIATLKENKVPDVLFFVTTKNFNTEGRQRIERYTDAGFHLGSHSHSHKSANKIGVDHYMADARRAKAIIDQFDNTLPFHRFPYLHHGADREAIETLNAELLKIGYSDGYVTVDNFDFYINSLIVKAKEQNKVINWQAAEQIYVEVLWQAIEFYDQLAKQTLQRSPKHVLLLHENDAAALFVGALVKHIRQQGWTIISPQEAYQDPISQELPPGITLNQGRIAALALSKGVDKSKVRHPAEDEAYLENLFKQRKVFSDNNLSQIQ